MEDPEKSLAHLEDLCRYTKALAYFENVRVRARELREAFKKGPPTREIARELGLPPPPDNDAAMIAQAIWFERAATRAIVKLRKKIGVEPLGVYRNLPVRPNRKPPRVGRRPEKKV
jgi:hypothetical protein